MKKWARRPPPPPASGLDPKEQELFLQAFYSGEVTKEKELSPDELPQAKPPVLANLSDEERDLFLQAVNHGALGISRESPREFMRSPKNYPSKKRGTADAQIDLHGMVAEAAVQSLLEFINREKARGSKTLLVVHGKGTGILRNAVWSVLETHPGVDDFQVAPAKFGGGGALIVRINRKVRRI